jgi:ketosteroid isomerase-like protein
LTNDEIVRRLFDAFARSDGFALRGVFAEDAVWVVPGRSLLAGTYNGRHEIFRFLGRLRSETGGTYATQLVDALSSDARAAAVYHARGERHGRTLDLEQVLLFRIEQGRIVQVTALPCDPAAFEEFWAQD